MDSNWAQSPTGLLYISSVRNSPLPQRIYSLWWGFSEELVFVCLTPIYAFENLPLNRQGRQGGKGNGDKEKGEVIFLRSHSKLMVAMGFWGPRSIESQSSALSINYTMLPTDELPLLKKSLLVLVIHIFISLVYQIVCNELAKLQPMLWLLLWKLILGYFVTGH